MLGYIRSEQPKRTFISTWSLAFLFMLTYLCFCANASELSELESNMIITVDKVENIEWIRDKLSPANLSTRNGDFQIRISRQSDGIQPRLNVGYVAVADDWIYMNEMVVNADGEIWTLPINIQDVIRDSYSQTSLAKSATQGILGGIARGLGGYSSYYDTNNYYYWETVSMIPRSMESLQTFGHIIVKAANAKVVRVRLKNGEVHFDFTLDDKQKTALRRAWRYFELKSGFSSVTEKSGGSNKKSDEYYDSRFEQLLKDFQVE